MTEFQDHDRLTDLVLSIEDLGDAERIEAEKHLEVCAQCSGLLASVREKETLSRLEGQLPKLDQSPGLELSPEEDAEERRSYRSLLSKVQTDSAGERGSANRDIPTPEAELFPWWTGFRKRFWAAAVPSVLAAVVVALLLFQRDGLEIHQLAVVPLESGTTRGMNDPEVWRNGQAFALEIELTEAADLFVVLVDPAGEVSLVHPSGGSSERAPRGQIRIPPASSGTNWVLSGAPGVETFLVVGSDSEISLSPVRDKLDSIEEEPDRVTRLRELRTWLRENFHSVREVEIDHAP